jgi:hypothetical protein
VTIHRAPTIRAAFACALLSLGSCATGPDVHVEYDKSASFAAYRTYAFQSPLGTDKAGYEGSVSRELKIAARRELDARGLRYDEASPDLLVNFNGKLSEKLRVATPIYPLGNGYYSYRGYTTWTGYPSSDPASYTEGTLNIDIADRARNQLVWEGVVAGTVGADTLAHTQEAIDAAVKAALAKFPPH